MVSFFTVEEARLNRGRKDSEVISFPIGNNTVPGEIFNPGTPVLGMAYESSQQDSPLECY